MEAQFQYRPRPRPTMTLGPPSPATDATEYAGDTTITAKIRPATRLPAFIQSNGTLLLPRTAQIWRMCQWPAMVRLPGPDGPWPSIARHGHHRICRRYDNNGENTPCHPAPRLHTIKHELTVASDRPDMAYVPMAGHGPSPSASRRLRGRARTRAEVGGRLCA